MSKGLFLLSLTALLTFAACEKKDENKDETKNHHHYFIVFEWKSVDFPPNKLLNIEYVLVSW